MGQKIEVTLPYKKETSGTVVYGVSQTMGFPIDQVYVRKAHLKKENGSWPSHITITVETAP